LLWEAESFLKIVSAEHLMKRRTGYNPKRRMRQNVKDDYLETLAGLVNYGGNPEHKRNPGNFGLVPPSQPRADKSLCDTVGIFSKAEATKLLRAGVKKGLISERAQNGYPQNIWAATDEGWPLEAQLENAALGTYHGYPMPETDPFREEVLMRWKRP
jgi:hypothetical protein